jgi:hypothetical protein
MKTEQWSIRQMREERSLSTLKNSYRINHENLHDDKIENKAIGNQTTLNLLFKRVRIFLEEE